MSRKDFLTREEVLFFDGGFGSYLIEKNIEFNGLSEVLNFTCEKVIVDIHKEYILSGANFITTNTFSANRFKLKNTEYSVEDVVVKAIENAKKAISESGKTAYVAQSISSTGKLMYPNGDLSFDEAYDIFKEQVLAGHKANTDVFLLETFMDISELRAAVLACKENSDKPLFVAMTFEENGKTLTGTDPKTFVNIIQNLGVDVIGVNCSLGPKKLKAVVDEIKEYSEIEIIVKPNRGIPKVVNGVTTYEVTEFEFLEQMKELCGEGVHFIGGCCGTNPKFIKTLVDNKNCFTYTQPTNKNLSLVSSSTQTLNLKNDIHIVGERLNPTGKKALQVALKERNFDLVAREAIKQVEHGAKILDVNAVVASTNEKDTLFKMMNSVLEVVDVPLQFDSTSIETIEHCLRYYPGRAIVNSINAKDSILEKFLPVIKKYGALSIALTIDENGIPKTKDERLNIADKLVTKWNNYGLKEHDLIIDALTLTVSAQQEEAFSTIECIGELKQKYSVLTTLGVSNISFGLPNRKIVNRTFLSFALASGLDLPIVDPFDNFVTETVATSRIILNIDKDSQDYISKYKVDENVPTVVTTSELTLSEIVLKGLRESAKNKTIALISEGVTLDDIINNELIYALNIVGDKFSKSELYLPDLIRSAETVKVAFEVIKEHMLSSGTKKESKGKVILATVKGDVHDIGKNIVKTVLENYSYDIIDLGKDVAPETVVHAIKEQNVSLVGLSALMTTTVESMVETIKLIRKEGLDCKVMVGGAVLTQEFADQIGADYYGKDANESVKIVNKFFE